MFGSPTLSSQGGRPSKGKESRGKAPPDAVLGVLGIRISVLVGFRYPRFAPLTSGNSPGEQNASARGIGCV